jgi:U3 small nucleolar RNA-associated protein 7
VTAIDIDFCGAKLATAGCDGSVRVWDMRNFDREYTRTHDRFVASDIAFSATGVLGTARGRRVEFFRTTENRKPFLAHDFDSPVKCLKFVTFDDFAICGLESGISSVVIPGSGEPNIDSNVANPFATPHARQEQEVRGLLDKIPFDMITMDVEGPIKVGRPKDKQKERSEALRRHRMVKKQPDEAKPVGTKEKSISMEKRLQMMKEEYNKQKIEEKKKRIENEKTEPPDEPQGPLARFVKAKQPRR